MRQDLVKVIVKMENWAGTRVPVLFFPESSANFGRIEVWAAYEGHGEADMTYMWSLKAPNSLHTDAVARALSGYEGAYKCQLQRVFRDSERMRVKRWR